MNNEEKIQAVEDALDGTRELIAQVRTAFASKFEDEFHAYLTGSDTSAHVLRTYWHFYDALADAVGEERCIDLDLEEQEKFEARKITQDPELWELYAHAMEEEMKEELVAFQTAQDPDDYEDWLAGRLYITRRKEYARKFYGGKVA